MPSIDSLPQEQRSVLNLVIKRECTFDEIAQLLDIDHEAVRERALKGLDSLGPSSSVPDAERGRIADYLLGQLSTQEAERVRDGLAKDPQQRAWARVVAAEIGPVSSRPLPEIPAAASKQSKAAAAEPKTAPKAEAKPATEDEAKPATEDEAKTDAGDEDKSEPKTERESKQDAAEKTESPAESKAESRSEPAPAKSEAESSRKDTADDRQSRNAAAPAPLAVSRRGGAILLGLLAAVIIALIVVLLTSGGKSSNKSQSTSTAAGTTPASQNSPSAGCKQVKTIPAGTQCLAAIPVISPNGAKQPSGAAEVLKIKANGRNELLVVGVGMPATTKNAYAVWLYDSKGQKSQFLGFYNKQVTKQGKMTVLGPLPSNAGNYDQLLVTSEHTEKPTKPGQIVLEGSFASG